MADEATIVANPYLTRLRAQYNSLQTSIQQMQERATNEKRDLSEEELNAITGQAKDAGKVAEQIRSLTEQEQRNLEVGKLAADLEQSVEDTRNAVSGAKQQRRTGNTQARERDPGHYRSAEEGGQNGFFADNFRALYRNDETAKSRLVEYGRSLHDRAVTDPLSSTVAGVGLVMPHWLLERFQRLNYQKRAFANSVLNIPLNGDSRPMTLPFESVGADAAVGDQAAEGDAPTNNNGYTTDTDTITPKPTTGEQVVTRQFLDQGSPAGDMLIYANLSAIYDSKIEGKVCTAAISGAGSNAVTIAFDTFAGGTGDTPTGDRFNDTATGVASNAVIDTTVLIDSSRFVTPTLVIVTPQRWGKFRKLRDTNGRPLMPMSNYQPQNAEGVATGVMAGEFEGLTVLKTTGMGTGASFPEKFLVVVPEDIWLFEDSVMQYRFEEKGGPEKITLGIWRYNAVKVVQQGLGVRTVTVTAAADPGSV